MADSALVLLMSHLAQAIGAGVLAIVLVAFHRLYQRRYLLTWAWSCGAFCVWLIGSGLSLEFLRRGGTSVPPPALLITLALIGGYWQLLWLLSGTRQVTTGQETPRRREMLALAALGLLAILTVALSEGLAPNTRFIVRIAPRAIATVLAYLVAGWIVWRSGERPRGLGQNVLAVSFLLYGLHQGHYIALYLAPFWLGHSPGYIVYLLPFDFLLQALMGLGIVIWLLEEERRSMIEASARIEHLAFHDPLTDLPNRHAFLQRLEPRLERARRRGRGVAVLCLDLDRFKVINDSLGHEYGNELLRNLAERLRRSVGSVDLLARLGEDELALALPEVKGEGEILQAAERLLGLVRLPFPLQGREIHVTASVGISRFPQDGAAAAELLRNGEIAMFRAKEEGGDQFQIFARSMDVHSLERLALENDLRKALTNGELVLFYQPVLEAKTRDVVSVEALLRWRHPERGLMPPESFLWLAEVTGLTNTLDLWVVRTACQEIRSWQESGGLPDVHVAVNLSARIFQHSGLVDRLREVLTETGLSPDCLELEITETLAMQNAEVTLGVLRGLKELGVRIAIDDFGTGYSSLSYLTHFPIDTLKVDRSFVWALDHDRRGHEIASAVIALAHSLDIAVVAEGVENAEQLRILEEEGCDKLQGFYFSPPVPAVECRDFILTRRSGAERTVQAAG
jgi:diguanylate cyclase (GGDEF)-like protein